MERMMQLLYGNRAQQPSTVASSSYASASSSQADAAASVAAAVAAGPESQDSGRRLATGGGSGRDPESHRMIEKRRRDRVNGALAELCCLIPSARAKQNQGRIEKAEIIEMAIQHIIVLTSLVGRYKTETSGHQISALCAENFQQGFLDATRVTLSFLADPDAPQTGANLADSLCAHLYSHLQAALQKYASAVTGDEDADITALLDSSSRAMGPLQQQQQQQQQQQHYSEPQLPTLQSEPPVSIPTSEPEAEAVDPARFSPPTRLVESDQSSGSGSGSGDADDEPHLPGFVLHPSGTHYLPLVLPRAALGKELLCRTRRDSSEDLASVSEVLHPVSIPVNFRSARRLRIAGRKRKRPDDAEEHWTASAGAESD